MNEETLQNLAHDCTKRIIETSTLLLRSEDSEQLVLIVPMWNVRDAIADMLKSLTMK